VEGTPVQQGKEGAEILNISNQGKKKRAGHAREEKSDLLLILGERV